MSGITISSLQVENVKRVKAVHLTPSPTGLTVIGGENEQGKSTVLDAIAWAVGGKRKAPSNPKRDGAASDPFVSVTLSNGLVVERKGKNSTLSVTDPAGVKSGQSLLDAFVSEFALDLPKFLEASNKDKAQILLRILGIGDELTKLDQDEARIYSERHQLGQMVTAKTKHAEELPEYPDAPAEPVSISSLITQQQTILAQNGENQRKREQADQWVGKRADAGVRVSDLRAKLAEAELALAEAETACAAACKSAENLNDESTAELEAQIADFEAFNAQVAANAQKAQAHDEAVQLEAQRDAKNAEIEAVRASRMALLDKAPLPLPGLSVEAGELIYNGQKWDGMATSEQLRVAVAIVRQLQPDCSFVLMDRLEAMTIKTMTEFGAWLEAEGLQVIATRVSTGAECSIIIEDGLEAGKSYMETTKPITPTVTPAPVVPDTF